MIITKEPIDIWNHSRQTNNMTLYLKSAVCENALNTLIKLGAIAWMHTTKLSLYLNTGRDEYWNIDTKSTDAKSLDTISYEVESISEESDITDDTGYQYKNNIGYFRVL